MLSCLPQNQGAPALPQHSLLTSKCRSQAVLLINQGCRGAGMAVCG